MNQVNQRPTPDSYNSFQRYLAAKVTVDDRALNRPVWERLVAALPVSEALGRPLQVLEVGAGIGTMVERLLAWLPPRGLAYTALDALPAGPGRREGFPPLPEAHNGRISLDAESLVLFADGTFLVGDEYGPNLYRFSANGVLLGAVRPPEAFIPRRGGLESFASNNPPAGRPAPGTAVGCALPRRRRHPAARI